MRVANVYPNVLSERERGGTHAVMWVSGCKKIRALWHQIHTHILGLKQKNVGQTDKRKVESQTEIRTKQVF